MSIVGLTANIGAPYDGVTQMLNTIFEETGVYPISGSFGGSVSVRSADDAMMIKLAARSFSVDEVYDIGDCFDGLENVIELCNSLPDNARR